MTDHAHSVTVNAKTVTEYSRYQHEPEFSLNRSGVFMAQILANTKSGPKIFFSSYSGVKGKTFDLLVAIMFIAIIVLNMRCRNLM